MATPMITRRGGYPVRYAKPVASARLAAEGAAAGDHVAIEYRFAGNRNEPLPSPRS
jgi:hypothetical protein